MKYIDGHYIISNNNTVYLLSTDTAVSMMVYSDNPLFFVHYNPYYGKITVEKTNKKGYTTKQKVSKKDKQYYTNIMKNFIMANTNFVLDNTETI